MANNINKMKTLIACGLSMGLLIGCGGASDPKQDDSAKTSALSAELPTLPHYLERDIRDEVFYFVMPDRFNNGDTSNDLGSKTIKESSGGFDPTSTGHFHGGDIKGLQDKLDYLQGMGITAIWLTPILRNQAVQGDSAGYHGYWPLDYTEIDPHLGTNEDLKNFIDAAHAKNMKVFFDIITNHTADVIKFKECHTEGKPLFSTDKPLCEYISVADTKAGKGYTPFIPEGNENLKSPAWLNDTKYYHNQGDSTWQGENSVYGDFMGLDDVDTDNPEVVKGMIDIFNGIIKQFKPDGFRIDTVKHVNIEFWQEFTPAITEYANSIGIPNFFVFGEVYSGDPNELSMYTTKGDMPSVLDFAFQYKAKEAFVESKGTSQLNWLFEQDVKYQDHNSSADLLMNFVSNHDVGRLAYFIDQVLPEADEAEKIKRFNMANALMYFARGIPVVYYGDEQGFTGDGGDRGAREDMMPSKTPSYNDNNLYGTDKTTADDNFDTSHQLYKKFREFADVYQQHKALRQGAQKVVKFVDSDGIFAFTRSLDGEEYLVVFNSAKESKILDAMKPYAGVVYGEGELSHNQVKVPALSFVIVK